MRTIDPAGSVPAWIQASFDEVVAGATPLPWGFRNETWLVELADGRRFATTRLADQRTAATVLDRIAALQPRLAAVGLPVPPIVASGPTRPSRAAIVMVCPFVEGIPGPQVLGERSGPAVVGALLGSAWRNLALADPFGLGLPDLWAEPDRLGVAARGWLDALSADLPRPARARLAGAIATLLDLPGHGPTGIVHGDLVPANVLVRDGRLAALLDLEFVRLGDRRLDAAWFDWIVWFHHRPIQRTAWEAFSSAGGIDEGDTATREAVRVLPAIRLLEILHELERDDPARARWREHLGAWLIRR